MALTEECVNRMAAADAKQSMQDMEVTSEGAGALMPQKSDLFSQSGPIRAEKLVLSDEVRYSRKIFHLVPREFDKDIVHFE